MYAVKTQNLCFKYDASDELALDGVDFELGFGEIALLSGSSGSGKSTLMSVVCGIIPHVVAGEISGKVYVAGEDASKMTMSEICRQAGVVLQNADAQIIQDTVEDEIAFGCENLGMTRERIKRSIETACERMSLGGKWHTRTLSGGQKQRLVTACTLAMGQKIIILDEPLANLDGEGAELLAIALKKLKSEGYAVLIIEHRVDKVARYADSIWHMHRGRIQKIEDKEEYAKNRAKIIPDVCTPVLSDEILLKMRDVSFSAEGRKILSGVDLDVRKGERLLVLGENGCGKTTLVRTLARLNKPTSGSVEQRIDAKVGRRAGKRWFESVGIVYQNPNYQLFMPTVEKEILFGAKDKVFARSVMRLFGLEKIAGRHPQSLSEGQKRLVTVAAVCATAPKVLILDEPTVGQDYENLERLVGLVNRLHSVTGNTVITVTHDVRCADALCDRAVVVADGRIAKQGGKEVAREFFGKFD